jgi:hypothetical protein
MAKTLYDLAKEASLLLNDSQHCDGEYDFTRWSQAELANYGLNAIILAQTIYPQKFTKVVKVALVQGSIQSLPEGCSKLVKVLGSNNEAGTVPSTSSSIDDRLAGIFPESGCSGSVTSNQGGYTVKNYSLEESSDTIFYVKPPVPFSEKPIEISVICSASPDTDPRKSHIPAWLWNPIIEFMMYRAYQSEDESQNSMQQMQIHLKNFYSMIEMYMRSEMMLTTNIGKQEVQNEAA